VLNHWPDYTDDKADVTVTVERATLTKVLTSSFRSRTRFKTGLVEFSGNPAKFVEFRLERSSSSQSVDPVRANNGSRS
jgi:alkyl sulfatase BDS1-like metallo-beta-lactamase superfamily hydrolase